MEPTQSNYGTPAANYPHMPNLDETTNAAADYNTVHLAPHGLSSPENADASLYNRYHGDTVPSHFEHEGEAQLLQGWNAQHQHQDNASTPTTHHARQRRQSIRHPVAPPPRPYTPASVKRKLSSTPVFYALPTLPPFLRQSPVDEGQISQTHLDQPSPYSHPYPGLGVPYPCDSRGFAVEPRTRFAPSSAHQPSGILAPHGMPPGRRRPLAHEPMRRRTSAPKAKQPPPFKPKAERPRPIDWDTVPQEITSDYGKYKWSVTHYEVNSGNTYGFAQSWLEDLFAANLLPQGYKWHTHSTQGFIKDGTRNSFIALHNADNPFEYGFPPSSTTSIGVYGHNWHEHNTIHWKTFAPDIRWLLDYCELEAGTTRVKQKWKFNMPWASERRFHRAYWLAASRGRMRGLLNRSPSKDVAHDAVEIDGGFEFTEEDVGNEWDNTLEEANQAWKIVQEELEDMGEVGNGGYEHVVTGSSERESELEI